MVEYCRFRKTSLIKADIVICDHALGEIDTIGLQFIIRQSKEMLKLGKLKLFLFSSPGKQHINTMDDIINKFKEANYFHIYNREFHAFFSGSLEKAGEIHKRLVELFRQGLTPVQTKTNENIIPADLIVETKKDEAPLDYEFLAHCGFKVPHAFE